MSKIVMKLIYINLSYQNIKNVWNIDFLHLAIFVEQMCCHHLEKFTSRNPYTLVQPFVDLFAALSTFLCRTFVSSHILFLSNVGVPFGNIITTRLGFLLLSSMNLKSFLTQNTKKSTLIDCCYQSKKFSCLQLTIAIFSDV